MTIASRVSFEEFRERLAERVKHSCPMCGHKQWDCPGYVSASFEDWDESRTGRFPTIPIICKNCGFVAQFAQGSFE